MTMKKTTAVIGGGTMGADIALVLARAGCEAHVVEANAERRAALPAYLSRTGEQLGIRDRLHHVTIHEAIDKLPWQAIEVAIEAVPENLELKRRVFAELARHAGPGVLLASNSSAIPISRIAEGLPHPGRFLGMHWFMPAHSVPLIEVVLHPQADPARADELAAFVRAIGNVPVMVKKDLPGFIANRLQHALCREAYSLIEQGVATAADIDLAVRFGFGLRYLAAGPLRQRDHAGLDVHCAAAKTMYPTLANDAEPPRVLSDLVAAGHLGMKSGRGFYEWTPETAAADRARYDRLMSGALALLADELPPVE